MEVGGQRHVRTALLPGKNGTHFIGVWVGPRVGLDNAENLDPTVIRSPDHPVCCESLYRLSYPGSYITYFCHLEDISS